MQKPHSTAGLRHVALFAEKLEACVQFYTQVLGMQIIWQPDQDNVYLTTGQDNFALHRAPASFKASPQQKLDHIGFFLHQREDVDEWYTYLQTQNVTIKAAPKDHRDGTRSCYCEDPDGNVVQLIYYPIS